MIKIDVLQIYKKIIGKKRDFHIFHIKRCQKQKILLKVSNFRFKALLLKMDYYTMKRFYLKIAALLCLLLPSCKTIYLPSSTDTTTNVKDSTVLHIIDSVRYTERSRYKDYGDLLNVLEINGKRSHMRSWIDTTKNVLNGELTEDPIEEKTKVIVKTQYRDSIQTVEKKVPYPVEVVKEKTPKWCWYSLVINILGLILFALVVYLKVKGHKF